jgi:KUP system potassium uptake protein
MSDIAQPYDTLHDSSTPKPGLSALTLGCIGVVYGDIGTSPLYAFREAISAAGNAKTGFLPDDVLGVLSLIVWTLMIIVTLKYVLILLRADNQGEGGTLSLLALAQRAMGRSTPAITFFGMAGAALFFGDAVITPAISVLSAVEGLKLVTTTLEPYVLPITITIIIALFLVQSRGTAAIAAWFGPVMLVWFAVLALGGMTHIAANPSVLAAANPVYALNFLVNHGMIGLMVLGAVFLAVTGAEALYADLGHFGRKPIQYAWMFVAFPALVLNYLGQGALLLASPATLENPFFLMYPEWALLPVVILATLATIIASQAVITGAYSLTRQAIQLKVLPRMTMRHTSDAHSGQIYLPGVNTVLLICVLALVLAFGSSSKLASAYGIAVTGTMVVTALLAIVVVNKHWRWPLWAAVGLILPFLLVDLVFLGANLMKIFEGGFVPLILAALAILLMLTWVKGVAFLAAKDRKAAVPLGSLLASLAKSPPRSIPGTAVFLTAHPDLAPTALLHSLKHFKSLHEKNVILTIRTADVPRVSEEGRAEIHDIDDRFRQITLTYGYMDEPNVPHALARCNCEGWTYDPMTTSFILSRRVMKLADHSPLASWQRKLFMLLSRNATSATDYFDIPANRVVEIGTQVKV